MKILLNRNLHGRKKGEIIDLRLCNANDARYWRKAIKDSKIDKSVSLITDEEVKKEKKLQEAKAKKVLEEKNNKKEVNHDSNS